MPDPIVPAHLTRPEVRTFQRMALEREGQTFVGLRDPSMISQQMLVLPAEALPIVEHFNGQHSLSEISDRLGVPMAPLKDLVQKLDEIGMIWGPTFSRIEDSLRNRYRSDGVFPGAVAQMWGKDEATTRTTLSALLDAAEDPELGTDITGIVAPHLDAERGSEVYAAAYRALVGMAPPDRVVVLGTNHFGQGDGVVMSPLGFDTPMGRVMPEPAFVESLVASLGERLIKDEMDHVGEHSVQLQLPWVRYLFGDVPVVGALVPDPNAPMLSDDGARVSFSEFAVALERVIAGAPGRTLVIASSDLSHVGPGFGDPRPVDEAQQDEVERLDREMLGLFAQRDTAAFAGAFAANGNPTRWCSVGNMALAARVVGAESIELIDYRQSIDPRRLTLVSCAAIAFVGRQT